MTNELLKIKNFSLSYKIGSNNELHILRDINLTIAKKQKVAIVGESASGKSTLAYAILRLIPEPEINFTGEIIFFPVKKCCNETNLCNKEKSFEHQLNHIRGNHISLIFQDPFSALNPVIPIGKQIEEVFLNHNINISKDDLYKKSLELLNRVNLGNEIGIYKKFPHQLSGGQIQRICIAIAIANNPELLIADEPTTSLDASLRKSILETILNLVEKNDMSLLLITHDLNLVKDYVDYVYILYAGEIIEQGEVLSLIKEPLHPYTQMLISCKPEKSKKGMPLPTIPGQMPDLKEKNFFDRCIFLNRCTKKLEKCNFVKPNFYIHNNSKTKCFLYEK
jgi:oligopeptide/dipeptide ABC transporter ATP-binding protein